MTKLNASLVAQIKPGERIKDTTPGLVLVGSAAGGRWELRYKHRGRIRVCGLGSTRYVSLADARLEAQELMRMLKLHGIDPIEAKRAARTPALPEPLPPATTVPTFAVLADQVIRDRSAAGVSLRTSINWRWTVSERCRPIANKPVDTIAVADVAACLRPLLGKPEQFNVTRTRIAAVLSAAEAHGWCAGNAASVARVRAVLPPVPPRRARVEHHAAPHWSELPALYALVRERSGMAARCLEFVLLTGCRSGEARQLRWQDVHGTEWRKPRGTTKTRHAQVLPLSSAALDVLARTPAGEPDSLVFPGHVPGARLASDSLVLVLERINGNTSPPRFRDPVTGRPATVHGTARSGLRTWTADNHPTYAAAAEAILGHVGGSMVAAAYLRPTPQALEAQRWLLDSWSAFLTQLYRLS